MSATHPPNTWEDRPETGREAIVRVRAFQQGVVEHCTENGISGEDILTFPSGVIPLLARQHGLLALHVASGKTPPLDIAVFLMAADLYLPPVGLLTVTLNGEDAESAGTVSFYPTDSLLHLGSLGD